MVLISFFKLPKPKQFNYEPLYYDERKEQLQERIRNIEIEMGKNPEGGTVEIKRTLGRGSFAKYRTIRRKHQRQSSIRLIIIIAVLFLIIYLLFYR
jgi:hypothetical protein